MNLSWITQCTNVWNRCARRDCGRHFIPYNHYQPSVSLLISKQVSRREMSDFFMTNTQIIWTLQRSESHFKLAQGEHLYINAVRVNMLTDACFWHESHWKWDFTLFFISSLVHKTICVSNVTIHHPSKSFWLVHFTQIFTALDGSSLKSGKTRFSFALQRLKSCGCK